MMNKVLQNKEKFFDLWAPYYDFLLTTIFYQAIHKRLLEYVKLGDNSHVLDLGCGTGRLLNRLATHFPTLKGIGLDLSAEMLRQARERNQHKTRLIYIQGNAEDLPFADGQFDAVFNTVSFLHYLHPQKVFEEVSGVIFSGGYFYLVDWTVREEIGSSYFPFSPNGMRFYSPQQREQLGASVGLKCLNHYYLLGRILLTIFTKL